MSFNRVYALKVLAKPCSGKEFEWMGASHAWFGHLHDPQKEDGRQD